MHYRPGSTAYEENRKKYLEAMYKDSLEFPEMYSKGLTKEDFVTGRFSKDYYDLLSVWAADRTELEQILWSDDLKKKR